MDETSKNALLQDDSCVAQGASVGVHLIAGLPTAGVRKSFERMSDVMAFVPLSGIAGASLGEATQVGVLLPPFIEPESLVESWLRGDILRSLFSRPAHLASVSTFLDIDEVIDQISSPAPLSGYGWGQGEFDRRSVADIVVGQIESATHLVLVGSTPVSESLARCLTVLNPGASAIPIREGSPTDMNWFACQIEGDDRSKGRVDPEHGNGSIRSAMKERRTTAVVPPWLKVLQGEAEPQAKPQADLLVYRRALPFDPVRLQDWLSSHPEGILRAKGRIWFASEPEQSFGYSCAGSVHRVFQAGPWWASCAEGAWPSETAERERLLKLWHPRFGDRRQELVFAGVDLDRKELFSGLDTCLLDEDAIDDLLRASTDGSDLPALTSLRIQ